MAPHSALIYRVISLSHIFALLTGFSFAHYINYRSWNSKCYIARRPPYDTPFVLSFFLLSVFVQVTPCGFCFRFRYSRRG